MNQDFLKEMDEDSAPIKSYSTSELCELYGRTRYIINKWIRLRKDEIGERDGWFYSPKQVGIIFRIYGIPPKKTQ